MKKIVMFTLSMIVSAVAFGQQEQNGRREAATRKVTEMKEVLDLSARQEERIRLIHEKYDTRMSEARAERLENKTKFQQQFRELRAQRNEEINSVLTAEQKESWTKHREEKQKQYRNRHERKNGKSKHQLKRNLDKEHQFRKDRQRDSGNKRMEE
jgi:periplasmic protein CpxP/Spy